VSRTSTWSLENLAGGMDRRRREAVQPNTVRLAKDCRFMDGAQVANRPPVRHGAVPFSRLASQGLHGPLEVNGRLVAINTSGVTVTVPGEISQVLTVSGVDSTSLARTFLDWEVCGDVLCVLFGRETATANHLRVELHVWDGAGDFGTQVCGFGMPWAEWDLDMTQAWRPKLGLAGGALVLSGTDGNVYRSAVGNPRVWWDLDQEDQYDDGWEFSYYFSGHVNEKAVVPVDFFRICVHGGTPYALGFNGYEVEILKTDGTKVLYSYEDVPLTQVTNGGSSPTYSYWVGVVRFMGISGLYKIRVFPPRPGMKRGRYYTQGTQDFRISQSVTITTIVATVGQRVLEIPGSRYWFNKDNCNHISVSINGATPHKWAAAGDWEVSAEEKRDLGYDYAMWGTQIKLAASIGSTIVAGDIIQVVHQGHFCTGYSSGHIVTHDPCLVMESGKVTIHRGSSLSGGTYFGGWTVLELVKQANGYWKLAFRTITDGGVTVFHVRGAARRVYLGILYGNGGAPWTAHANPVDQTWEEAIWTMGALMSGRDDAGMLPLGKRASGAAITGLVGIGNRLLVTWKSQMALLGLNLDSSNDQYLGRAEYGTGDHTSPMGIEVDGRVVIPVSSGFAEISLGDRLTDQLGAQIISSEFLAERDSHDDRFHFDTGGVYGITWWPDAGCLVIAAKVTSDDYTGLAFLVRQKIGNKTLWMIWPWTAPPSATFIVGSMHAFGRRLYWREESVGVSMLAWLDMEPADQIQRDDSAFPIVGVLRFNHLRHGSTHFKMAEMMDVGLGLGVSCAMRFQLGSSGNWRTGPTITASSFRNRPLPVAFGDLTVAPEFTLTAGTTGFRLDSFAFTFRQNKRGP
jgi:hypothetical protein